MLSDMTPINSSDLEALDALRVERFRAFFAPRLQNANIYLGELDRSLIISAGYVAGLTTVVSELLVEAWFILGANKILIYQCNELIYESVYKNYNKIGENAAVGFKAMVAISEYRALDINAVENGTQIAPVKSTPAAKIVRSVSVSDLAADLEAQQSSIQEFLRERGATLIDFQGTIVVPESEAVVAYEHYSLIRARQKMQERFAAASTQTGGEKLQASATKNTAPKESKPKKPSLTFKGKFQVNRSNYKRTVQNFLDAMFPDKKEEQVAALDDISQQTEMGKAYLDKILRVGEYKDKEHAKVNLLKAAAQLQGGSNNGSEDGEKNSEMVTTG